MEQTSATTAPHAPAANKWLIAVAVMLATILEVLDMTIAKLMAFVDDFRLIAWIFFLLIPVVFLIRRPQVLGGSATAH